MNWVRLTTTYAQFNEFNLYRTLTHNQLIDMDHDQFTRNLERIISYKDAACIELRTVDLGAQLYAIEDLLQRHHQADSELETKISDLYERASEFAKKTSHYWIQDEEWINESYRSFFQNAAHSMSAAGVLAPFVESMFVRIFQRIREGVKVRSLPNTSDDTRIAAVEDEYWDPHWVFNPQRRRCLVSGICQLSIAVGLDRYFPKDYKMVLTALFMYRNKLFHHGFEWPSEEVVKFKDNIQRCSWPREWFDVQLKNDEPWIYYMSDSFIKHCLKLIDSVLEGTGRFLRSPEKHGKS